MTLALVVFVAAISACAGDDKPISFSELPQNTQAFINQYFPGQNVAFVKVDTDFLDKEYEVIFTSGDKAEFDANGEWKELKCTFSQVPTDCVPNEISEYISKTFPDTKIIEIERDTKKTEVKISTGIEIEFDKNYNVIEIDN